MPKFAALLCAGFLASVSVGFAADGSPSEDEIRQILIRNSIAGYAGNCPCPYNLDRAGRRCGKRSAYSKPGGHAPLCYPRDVTAKMIERYQQQGR